MLFLNWHQFRKAANVDLDLYFGYILKYCTQHDFLLHPAVARPPSIHVIPAMLNSADV